LAGSANTTWFVALATQRYSPFLKSSRARAITASAPPMYSTVLRAFSTGGSGLRLEGLASYQPRYFW